VALCTVLSAVEKPQMGRSTAENW